MSKFPLNYDDDISLPFVNNNLTEIGSEAINAVRDATFNIEQYLGIGANGTTNSLSDRLNVSLNPDGTIKPSAIASLGLITLPITNNQISNLAQIEEYKLKLDHKTSDLYNYIFDLSTDVNTSLNWISGTGVKVDPHLMGVIFRHNMDQVDVTSNPSLLLKNKYLTNRDNSNSYTLINDINNELLNHHFADGTQSNNSPILNVITSSGEKFPGTYAHTGSGIYLNTVRFQNIPQNITDVQKLSEYLDTASLLIDTIIKNLYSNGISRSSRSSRLISDGYGKLIDGYGQSIIPPTTVITYLFNNGSASSPFDDISLGDDIIEFKPTSQEISSNSFDAKFHLIKVGDIITVNYGNVETKFLIKEKKYIQDSNPQNKKYIVRINGRNFAYKTNAKAQVDKPLFNNNKYGVLAVSAVNNNFNEKPSLLVVNPRAASVTGVDFNPDLLDENHCLLYLALYPNGNPDDGYKILPAIDVTGNQGLTPGKYTLSSIIESTNESFRKVGYNYRFSAFENNGQFGIALADSYNNASFSIINMIVGSNGMPDQAATITNFPRNVIGVFSYSNILKADPLGFGSNKSNYASPLYVSQYSNPEAALYPTKIFVPLRKNNFYTDGIQLEGFSLENGQIRDKYGDGYWNATVLSVNVIPPERVEVRYSIPLDLYHLSAGNCNLEVGKTIVVQTEKPNTNIINSGRFIIKSINSSCSGTQATEITVYDAIHANSFPPPSIALIGLGDEVRIYFNSDSISFNSQNSTDTISVGPFKRHFEVYVDKNGKTFTHERARINISDNTILINSTIPLYTNTELKKLNIVKVSPKLRGYQYQFSNKISLKINEINSANGVFNGYLCSYDGLNYSNKGPVTLGKLGEVTRFYDESNIDYIDIIFDVNDNVANASNAVIDFQLFPSLIQDDEIMLISTCQLNDATKKVNYLIDRRQFGNISEKDLTTSALGFISLGEKLLHSNGVIKGFDLDDTLSSLTGTLNNGSTEVKIDVNGSLTVLAQLSGSWTGTVTFQATNAINPTSGDWFNISAFNTQTQSYVTTTTSAGNFIISSPYKSIRVLGAITASSCTVTLTPSNNNQKYIKGGTALVNGKFIDINNQFISIPVINRLISTPPYFININWALCINDKSEFELIPISDQEELFKVVNIKYSTQPYKIKSSTFANIVNKRKDLLILYVVEASVDMPSSTNPPPPPFMSLKFIDARRYINDIENNLPLILTDSLTEGNFRNLESILSWVKYNNKYTENIIISNYINDQSCTINNSTILNFDREVIIDGRNYGKIIFNAPVTFGSNLTIKNATIYINNGTSIINNVKNLNFINCNFIIRHNSTPSNNITFDINNGSNINISDGYFDVQYSSSLVSSSGSIFRFTGCNNINISDTKVFALFNIPDIFGAGVPGDIIIFRNNSNYLNIDGCNVDGDFNQFVRITNSNNISIKNSIVQSNFNPVGKIFDIMSDSLSINDGLSPIIYNSTLLRNNSRGYIYSNISNSLDNLIIDNVTFNYNPITASYKHRFPFINLELLTGESVVSNLLINNCKFNNKNMSDSVNMGDDDLGPAISIINLAQRQVKQPIIKNSSIKNNYCNRNQSIILTSYAEKTYINTITTMIESSGLVAQNVIIENNICGSIGYWVSSSKNINKRNDNQTSLTIKNNLCKLINNVDETGKYFLINQISPNNGNVYTNLCKYPSGNVIIENNFCNWIHVSISYEQSSSLKIINNNLNAYDFNFLIYFENNAKLFSTLNEDYAYKYAIVIDSNILKTSNNYSIIEDGNDSSCIVLNNIISTGFYDNNRYSYFCYLFCRSSSIIENNIFKGIYSPISEAPNDLTPGVKDHLISLNGLNNIFKNNKVYRNLKEISSYICILQIYAPEEGILTLTKGIITNNFFDSPYTLNNIEDGQDDSLYENITSPKPENLTNWIIKENINQTSFSYIALTNQYFINNYIHTEKNSNNDDMIIFNNVYDLDFRVKSRILAIRDFQQNTANIPAIPIRFAFQEDLNKYIPINAKIISLETSVRKMTENGYVGNDTMIEDSMMDLYIYRYDNKNAKSLNFPYVLTTPEDVVDKSIVEGYFNDNPPNPPYSKNIYSRILSTDLNKLQTNKIKINLTKINPQTGMPGSVDVSNLYTINNSPYTIAISFNVNIQQVANKQSAEYTGVSFYISPITVKYRW